jgi:hypothetical protein
MKNWFYNDEEIVDISQFPEDAFGFIYVIVNNLNNKFYVGKKNLFSERNIKLGKRELAALTDKRLSKKKKVKKESDWKSYWGSEEELKKDIKEHGYDNLSRRILYISGNKASLTYQELRHQILLECLESENSYNKNILGKFFKKVAE